MNGKQNIYLDNEYNLAMQIYSVETIMLSERCQSEKTTYYMIPFLYEIFRNKISGCLWLEFWGWVNWQGFFMDWWNFLNHIVVTTVEYNKTTCDEMCSI